MIYEVFIKRDADASVWIAICNDPCLALEADSCDVLIERVQSALPELITEMGKTACSAITYRTSELQQNCKSCFGGRIN